MFERFWRHIFELSARVFFEQFEGPYTNQKLKEIIY